MGNTPTRVGKTVNFVNERKRYEKHPHACGEDDTYEPEKGEVLETPPRVWGRPDTQVFLLRRDRNTPTRVGKTSRDAGAASGRGKHPHACGEDEAIQDSVEPPGETPPRVWGRPGRRPFPQPPVGNTPTRVGKTSPGSLIRPMRWKHPHACGEDAAPVVVGTLTTETPPRVWGRLGHNQSSRMGGRNTPTRVGKTKRRSSALRPGRKHPHACGEDSPVIEMRRRRRETPPRVWGRQQHLVTTWSVLHQI